MARNENKTQTETETETESGSQRGKWKWQENSNHKLGIYLRSVNDYHLKCARLPPKNQLLEKAQPTEWVLGCGCGWAEGHGSRRSKRTKGNIYST
ncbi:uncharacterized protein LOC108108878 [Drosophila eugracilis]|uniref:uncharacterized protein LOC108108878 n=1 Tax=Drosophila eugracilis TaxID=29029 RepID=UPI0007E840BC|nr:uncharacterized protein LOC108108878 [Drosophila eugracilis]